MERYKMIKTLGDGTYGTVMKANNKKTGQIVAIKKMKKKFYSWEQCLALRQIKSLRKLTHDNIVSLKEVIRDNDDLFFVFEYLSQNVYQLIKDRTRQLPEDRIKSIMYQTLSGLSFMHKYGFFHRDLKPENLLFHNGAVKIADFGLARQIRSRPPFTDYVSTRWYRAPQIILRSTNYNSPIDIFALGAIMAEFYLLRPIFPGQSQTDQLYKICAVLGSPTQSQWPQGYRLANALGFSFPSFVKNDLSSIIKNASQDACDLMQKMFHFDPKKRPTAQECLQHPYFKGVTVPKYEPPKSSHGIPRKTKGHGFGVAEGAAQPVGGVASPGQGSVGGKNQHYGRVSPANRKMIPSRDKPAQFKNSFYSKKGDILEKAEKLLAKNIPGQYQRQNSGNSSTNNKIPSRASKRSPVSRVQSRSKYQAQGYYGGSMPPANKKLSDLPLYKGNLNNNNNNSNSYMPPSYKSNTYQPSYGGVMADLHNPAQGSGDQVSFPSIKSRHGMGSGSGVSNNKLSSQRQGGGYIQSLQNNYGGSGSVPSVNKFGSRGNQNGFGGVGQNIMGGVGGNSNFPSLGNDRVKMGSRQKYGAVGGGDNYGYGGAAGPGAGGSYGGGYGGYGGSGSYGASGGGAFSKPSLGRGLSGVSNNNDYGLKSYNGLGGGNYGGGNYGGGNYGGGNYGGGNYSGAGGGGNYGGFGSSGGNNNNSGDFSYGRY